MKTQTMQQTDNQLVQHFQEGNNKALEELISRHKDKIFTSIFYLVKDRFLAEDLFQDVFIKIIDTLRANRYNEEGKFVQWAVRIAHNLCLDHLRKVKRRPAIVSNSQDDFVEECQPEDDSCDKDLIRCQSHTILIELVNALPQEQREVVILRHFGELSFKEIAALTHCSLNTVLGRMRYGLMNIRKLAQKYAVEL